MTNEADNLLLEVVESLRLYGVHGDRWEHKAHLLEVARRIYEYLERTKETRCA